MACAAAAAAALLGCATSGSRYCTSDSRGAAGSSSSTPRGPRVSVGYDPAPPSCTEDTDTSTAVQMRQLENNPAPAPRAAAYLACRPAAALPCAGLHCIAIVSHHDALVDVHVWLSVCLAGWSEDRWGCGEGRRFETEERGVCGTVDTAAAGSGERLCQRQRQRYDNSLCTHQRPSEPLEPHLSTHTRSGLIVLAVSRRALREESSHRPDGWTALAACCIIRFESKWFQSLHIYILQVCACCHGCAFNTSRARLSAMDETLV